MTIRAARLDSFYLDLINIVLLPNKLRPDGTSISSYRDFDSVKNNEYYRKMMFATKFIPMGGENTGFRLGTNPPEPYETEVDYLFAITEESIVQNWIRRLKEWDDGGAAAMLHELSGDYWIIKWSANPEIHMLWEHFGWPEATLLPEEWHTKTAEFIREEFDLDISIELTEQQLQEWISELRARDMRGDLPEEWITEITSGRPRIFSAFSDIIEINLLDTVSDIKAEARYNFWTTAESDIRIENIGILSSDGPHPRWIELNWIPIVPPLTVDREGVLPEEARILPRGFMNNLAGNTIEVETEGREMPLIDRGIVR